MDRIIDFHTHVFPDSLAARAIATLEASAGGEKAVLDGRVSSLLASMDRAGIEKSVVCSIATKPAQFDPVLSWSKDIRSDRIIPLLSFHPADTAFRERIRICKEEGFKGLKFHPFYQDFSLDEERMLPIYEEIAKAGLIMVVHTGYDIAFPRIRRADPAKILAVVDRFPGLKFITTHLGAWEQWPEVRSMLAGKPVYMELSFALDYLDTDPVREILLAHPKEYLLFGSDSPWSDQAATILALRGLGLGEEKERAMLLDNAERLLSSV